MLEHSLDQSDHLPAVPLVKNLAIELLALVIFVNPLDVALSLMVNQLFYLVADRTLRILDTSFSLSFGIYILAPS